MIFEVLNIIKLRTALISLLILSTNLLLVAIIILAFQKGIAIFSSVGHIEALIYGINIATEHSFLIAGKAYASTLGLGSGAGDSFWGVLLAEKGLLAIIEALIIIYWLWRLGGKRSTLISVSFSSILIIAVISSAAFLGNAFILLLKSLR